MFYFSVQHRLSLCCQQLYDESIRHSWLVFYERSTSCSKNVRFVDFALLFSQETKAHLITCLLAHDWLRQIKVYFSTSPQIMYLYMYLWVTGCTALIRCDKLICTYTYTCTCNFSQQNGITCIYCVFIHPSSLVLTGLVYLLTIPQ